MRRLAMFASGNESPAARPCRNRCDSALTPVSRTVGPPSLFPDAPRATMRALQFRLRREQPPVLTYIRAEVLTPCKHLPLYSRVQRHERPRPGLTADSRGNEIAARRARMLPSNHEYAPVFTPPTHRLAHALRLRLASVALAATVGAAAIVGVSARAPHAVAATGTHQTAITSDSVGGGGGPGQP